jgi:hypothetical protein
MKVTRKVHLDPDDLEFLSNGVCKFLGYRSKSEYMRVAIQEKIRGDKRTLRAMKRQKAAADYSKGYENAFASIAAEPFED